MTLRPVTRALALGGALGAVVTGLWAAGRALPAPPLTSWPALSRWYAQLGPDAAVASLVRLAALAVAGWLLVATAAQLVAIAGAPELVRRSADLIAPRSLQRFVHGLAGVSLSAGLAVVAPSAGIPAVVTPALLVAEPPPGTAALRLLPAEALPATPVPVVPAPPAAAAPPEAPPSVSGPPATAPAATVVVEPGDSLWSIAEEALLHAGAVGPDDRAIERYWRRLIDINRGALVHPDNPDLIYPGQTVVLPIS